MLRLRFKSPKFLLLLLLVMQPSSYGYPSGTIVFPRDSREQVLNLTATRTKPEIQQRSNAAAINSSMRREGAAIPAINPNSFTSVPLTSTSSPVSANQDDQYDDYGDYGPKYLGKTRPNCVCMLENTCLETKSCPEESD